MTVLIIGLTTFKLSANSLSHIMSAGNFFTEKMPSLHPLIVHFPVVLIPVLFGVKFVNLFLRYKEWNRLAIILLVSAIVSSVLSGFFIHPHTTGLSESARYTLENHETYAYITTISLCVTAVLEVFKYKSKIKTLNYIILLLLFISTVGITITGHLGGKLVYVHEVGPNGNYLHKSDH